MPVIMDDAASQDEEVPGGPVCLAVSGNAPLGRYLIAVITSQLEKLSDTKYNA